MVRSVLLEALKRPFLRFWLGALAVTASFAAVTLQVPIYDTHETLIASSAAENFVPASLWGLARLALPVLVATAGYLVCLHVLRDDRIITMGSVVVACGIAGTAALPSVPLTSPDATHTAADVRTLWLHGIYPSSSEGVPGLIDDPVARQVIVFKNEQSAYGPLSYVIGGAHIPFVGDGLGANVFGVKAVGGLCLILTAFAAGWVAWRLRKNGPLAVAAVGLNPLLIWEFPGEGHNDSIMTMFAVAAVGGLVAVEVRGRLAGILGAAAAVLAKFSMVVLGPLIVAYWLPRLRLLVAAAVALSPFLLLVWFWFESSNRVAFTVSAQSVSVATVWEGIADVFDSSEYLSEIFWVGFGLIAAAIVAWHPLRTPSDFVNAVAFLLFVLVFALPGYYPWYQVWCLPFAALSDQYWLKVGALVFSCGAFIPVLAVNFEGTLDRDLGIAEPTYLAALLLWGTTALVMYLLWASGRRAVEAEIRA